MILGIGFDFEGQNLPDVVSKRVWDTDNSTFKITFILFHDDMHVKACAPGATSGLVGYDKLPII